MTHGYLPTVLSILIVNWNTCELLGRCLHSILQFPTSMPIEVIVVDNASADGSADYVASEFRDARIKLVRSNVNLGFAAGNNLAYRESCGEFVLTLNPDTEFETDALEVAIQELQARPSYGAIAITQRGIAGDTQRSVRGFPTIGRLLWEFCGGARFFPSHDRYYLRRFDYTKAQDIEQPMATFTLFRREAIGSVLFDEQFPIFFNDVDTMKRLFDAGYKCWYTPAAYVRHHGGEGTKQVRKSMIWESHRSLLRYLRKHQGTGLSGLGLLILTPLVLAAAFVRAKGYHAGFRP